MFYVQDDIYMQELMDFDIFLMVTDWFLMWYEGVTKIYDKAFSVF